MFYYSKIAAVPMRPDSSSRPRIRKLRSGQTLPCSFVRDTGFRVPRNTGDQTARGGANSISNSRMSPKRWMFTFNEICSSPIKGIPSTEWGFQNGCNCGVIYLQYIHETNHAGEVCEWGLCSEKRMINN